MTNKNDNEIFKKLLQNIKKPLLTIILLIFFLNIIPMESILMYNLNPLIFGFSFFFVNRKYLKYSSKLGFFLTILTAYFAFFVGLFSLFGLTSLFELMRNTRIDFNIFIVISGLIASLTLFLIFTKIYNIKQLRKGLLIMTISYILVPIVVITLPILFYEIFRGDYFFILYNLTWLLVVGFFLTLVTNLDKKNGYVIV